MRFSETVFAPKSRTNTVFLWTMVKTKSVRYNFKSNAITLGFPFGGSCHEVTDEGIKRKACDIILNQSQLCLASPLGEAVTK